MIKSVSAIGQAPQSPLACFQCVSYLEQLIHDKNQY